MGSVVGSAISWVFGTVFYFAIGRVEDVVTWLLPIYMTVQVLRRKETLKFNNYLSFWCIASLLFGIDYASGFLLHSFLLFRLVRIIFLIWIFLDSCHNSVFLVNKFLTPLMDEHRQQIDDAFNLLNTKVDDVRNEVTTQVTNRVGVAMKESQAQIMTTVMQLGSNATKAVASMISNAEEADTTTTTTTSAASAASTESTTSSTTTSENANSNDNTSENNSDNTGNDKSSEVLTSASSDVTTDSADNKEVETES